MRIGHFLSHYPGAGGTTSMVLGLSRGLISEGHEVIVYGYRRAASDRGHLAERRAVPVRLKEYLFPHPRLHVLSQPFDALSERLSRNVDRLDALVIHGMFGPFSLGTAIAARRGGVPTIACPHDPYAPAVFVERSHTKRAYLRFVERPYLRRVSAIHVLAPSHESHIRSLGLEVPVIVVPNGLDRSRFGSSLPEATRVKSDRPLDLLYFGRWDIYNKGLDLLVEAVATENLRRRVHLHVAGPGGASERRRLDSLVATYGAVNVTLEGFLPDIERAIGEADCVILPSRFDGFGQVVLESLAVGTPVILSSAVGASEYLGRDDGVIVCDPHVEGIVGGIAWMLQHGATAYRNTVRSRASLASRFSWDVIARAWCSAVATVGVTNRTG